MFRNYLEFNGKYNFRCDLFMDRTEQLYFFFTKSCCYSRNHCSNRNVFCNSHSNGLYGYRRNNNSYCKSSSFCSHCRKQRYRLFRSDIEFDCEYNFGSCLFLERTKRVYFFCSKSNYYQCNYICSWNIFGYCYCWRMSNERCRNHFGYYQSNSSCCNKHNSLSNNLQRNQRNTNCIRRINVSMEHGANYLFHHSKSDSKYRI